MSMYECEVCGYIFDEEKEGRKWDELPEDWCCPVCDSSGNYFKPVYMAAAPTTGSAEVIEETVVPDMTSYLAEWARDSDSREIYMEDIHKMALTGKSLIEPMRTRVKVIPWSDILIKGAQLAKLPLNKEIPVNTKTVIGPGARQPLEIETPVFITHMSFGALSKELKIALAKGSAAVKTAMCSGEGGILKDSMDSSHKYIFEYVPNKYSVTEENLKQVDAVEIKIGQSAKPGMGGHLPGGKVTGEIAEVRGFPEGADIISPAHFEDITDKDQLKERVIWLREKTGGKPIGIKIAAGNIEADMEVATYTCPDFITIDGRPGSTGASPKFVKAATSIPTIYALNRARQFLIKKGITGISLIITGGLRISPDIAKALALGADAVAIGTAALMACGCQQYRVCNTGKCPVGSATQDPQLRSRLNIDASAKRLENFLRVTTAELANFARLTGNSDVHQLSITDLCTVNSEVSNHTPIEHV
ncbi:MAG: glutamate synthase [bacterium]|nr:glutamate synthase [bacterium]